MPVILGKDARISIKGHDGEWVELKPLSFSMWPSNQREKVKLGPPTRTAILLAECLKLPTYSFPLITGTIQ